MDDDLNKILERGANLCRTVKQQSTKSLCATAAQAVQAASETRTQQITSALNSCLTQEDSLVCIGLDGYDWLFAHGTLADEGTDRALAIEAFDRVLTAPCYTDEVRIRVVRTLLTAISTSPLLGRASLRRTISVLLEFGLLPSLHLRTTARAALAQIIGVFQLRVDGAIQAECLASVVTAVCAINPTTSPTPIAAEGAMDASLSLSLLLLHNLFVAAPADDVFFVPALRDAIAVELFPFLATCAVNPNAAIHKSAFFILKHLFSRLRNAFLMSLAQFVNIVCLNLISGSWCTSSQREESISLLTFLVRDENIVRELFSSFDCTAAQPNLFHQLLVGASKAVQTLDDVQRVQLLDTFHALLNTLRDSLLADLSTSFGRDVETAAQAKRTKKDLQVLIDSFNANPKNGVKLAAERGLLIETDAESIARFLLSTPGLDKEKIGNYLGGHAEFFIGVMNAFVGLFDFHGLQIDEALRALLGRFKPVGEAAIVDRTMNAFSAHYCAHNPTAFANQDIAHIMSFSLMMLNTDLHSPHVKEKMTFAGFSSMLRGVNDGADFAVSFLEGIFERIKNREIKLSDVEEPVVMKQPESDDVFVSEKKKRDMATKMEMDHLIARVRRAPNSRMAVRSLANIVPEVWESAWSAVLAAFSVASVDGAVDAAVVASCLTGFEEAMTIACRLPPSTHRDVFASTVGNMARSVSTVTGDRSAKSFQLLLHCAKSNGEYFDTTWALVIKTVSDIERVRQSATGDSVADPAVEDLFQFGCSTLSPRALEYFVVACVAASYAELLNPPAPRLMCFEQAVNALLRNTERIEDVWPVVWPRVSAHFVAAASARHADVPLLALNQLRQLALQLFDNPVLLARGWQSQLLSPFAVIATRVRTANVRDLLLDCIRQIVEKRGASLGPAWSVIMAVTQQCANSANRQIVEKAYEMISQATMTHLVALSQSASLITMLLHTLASFALNTASDATPVPALSLLTHLAVAVLIGIPDDLSALSTSPFTDVAPTPRHRSMTTSDDAEAQRLILCALANMVAVLRCPRTDVASLAIDMLHMVLFLPETASFTEEMWKLIVGGVICPIFDNLLADIDENCSVAHVDSTAASAEKALAIVTQLLTERPMRPLFPELFGCAVKIAHCEQERLSLVGARTMDAFCDARSRWSTPQTWQTTAEVTATNIARDGQLSVEAHARFVSLTASSLSNHLTVPDSPLRSTSPVLLDALWSARQWTIAQLDAIGFQDPKATFRLLDAQRSAIHCAFRALMNGTPPGRCSLGDWVTAAVDRLLRQQHQRPQEAETLSTVVSTFLEQMNNMADATAFQALFQQLRLVLCDLIRSCDARICNALAPVFQRGTGGAVAHSDI